jgi:hypothetical protein
MERFGLDIFSTGLVWKISRLPYLMERFGLDIFRTGLVWKISRLPHLMEGFGLGYSEQVWFGKC